MAVRPQLSRIEWFQDKVVGSAFNGFQPFPRVALRRHDDDGDQPCRAMFLQPVADVEPVASRRDQIDQQKIRWIGFTRAERRRLACDDADVMAFAREQALKESRAHRVVIGNQNACTRHVCR